MPLSRKCLALLCSLSVTGCLRVEEKKIIQPAAPEHDRLGWKLTTSQDFSLDYFIYRPTQYPLQTFFSRLSEGEFSEAIENLNLKYKTQNHSNKALEKLIDEGLVPVYLHITNTSQKKLGLSKLNITLSDTVQTFHPENNRTLPKFFKELNIKAFGANIVNATAMVGVLALLVMVVSQGNSHTGIQFNNLSGKLPFYSTSKELQVSYHHFLFTFDELEPSEERRGLAFFYISDGTPQWDDLFIQSK